jgi:hypothetical protein
MVLALHREFEPERSAVADAIVKLVDTPFGMRPFRVHVDPTQDGADHLRLFRWRLSRGTEAEPTDAAAVRLLPVPS